MAEGSRGEATNPLIRRARDALSGASQNPNREEEAAPSDVTTPPSDATTPRISPLGRSLTEATNRISEIVDAAERVAHQIQADAEDEASRYLATRKRDADALVNERSAELNDLTGSLTDRVEELKREVDSMSKELERTVERMKGLADTGTSAPEEVAQSENVPPPRSASIPRPVAYSGTEREDAEAEDADAGAESREHAVLRATQLAVAGTERSEIVATLESELGIGDAEAVVDEILGPAA